ncbi:Adenosine monophosphate-protein transferase SoFic [termite gut metagenome]|uniref:Adenosine monophosphate-protein transferase SoFic n=1 Tax=termite gut metagenome TaxID=433724 RepID=A0A5J4RQT5_9ZZZZ
MKAFQSGVYISQGYYKSFQPTELCRSWQIDNMDVIKLLSKADRQLGRIDMYSEYIDIEMFIQMHIAKEATQSSKIEGTQTNMEEAFLNEADISSDRRDDWEEVQNYILAMNEAVKLLHTLPFSARLIKQTHKVLLQGVRGQYKQPGEFRRNQNWIGGATINDAVFVPPVHTSVADYISDIEKFANNDEFDIPDLIKIALIHYQFETVHPFLDGNGRVGRLLITLYLVSKGILKQPILYLSDFFEKNRMYYYDNLMRVRTHNDMDQWLKFFLSGVIETAEKGVETFNSILLLQKSVDSSLEKMGKRSADARLVMHYLYKKPIISVVTVTHIIGKTQQTAYTLVSDLEEAKILHEITGSQRNKLYVFKDYIDLF